jgi:hypothetical protein
VTRRNEELPALLRSTVAGEELGPALERIRQLVPTAVPSGLWIVSAIAEELFRQRPR